MSKSKLSKYLEKHPEKNINLEEVKEYCEPLDDKIEKIKNFLLGPI